MQLNRTICKFVRKYDCFQGIAADKRILTKEFQRLRQHNRFQLRAFAECLRHNSTQTLSAHHFFQILNLHKCLCSDHFRTARNTDRMQLILTQQTVIHERSNHLIAFRNAQNTIHRLNLSNIRRCQNPCTFSGKLTHTNRPRIANRHQCLRLIHKENRRRIAVKVLRQKNIAESLTVIEAAILKFVQCFRYDQGQ